MDMLEQHFRDDEEVSKHLKTLQEPYLDMKRDFSDGPRNIGESLQLTDDFFCFNFLHQFRRRYVFVKTNGDEGNDTGDDHDTVATKTQ